MNSKLLSNLNTSAQLQKELETFVVNSLKVKMIKKLDKLLETEGKVNARKLFLVPIFEIAEMAKRIEEQAPEIKTMFYRELSNSILDVEKGFV